MSTWPDTRILDLLGIDVPIIQAPMAGATTTAMVIAASNAGALGSMPAAALSIEQLREALSTIRQASTRALNVNFFCHQPPPADAARDKRWKARLEPYYRELGADFDAPTPVSNREPFNEAACQVVEAFRPEVVSFHFGLPEKSLLDRVKATGAKVLSSATTVEEAIWLEQHGCDAIIAMGIEAGGHRGDQDETQHEAANRATDHPGGDRSPGTALRLRVSRARNERPEDPSPADRERGRQHEKHGGERNQQPDSR